LEYVKAALDKQKVGESVVRNYSHSLLDIPGEELTFNFDHVVIAEDRDEVDAMVLPLEGILAMKFKVLSFKNLKHNY